jgi:hypothetical protein
MAESNAVFAENAQPRMEGSNLLEGLASDYILMEQPLSFHDCTTLEEIRDRLLILGSLQVHLVGSQGYCFDSHNMASIVDALIAGCLILPSRLLTRSGGLRKRVLELSGFK